MPVDECIMQCNPLVGIVVEVVEVIVVVVAVEVVVEVVVEVDDEGTMQCIDVVAVI